MPSQFFTSCDGCLMVWAKRKAVLAIEAQRNEIQREDKLPKRTCAQQDKGAKRQTEDHPHGELGDDQLRTEKSYVDRGKLARIDHGRPILYLPRGAMV